MIKLFSFRDSWPWVLVLGLMTAPAVKGIIHNNGHLPAPAWIVLIATLVCAWGITILRYIRRAQWIGKIRYNYRHEYDKGIEFTIGIINCEDVTRDQTVMFKTIDAIQYVIEFWMKSKLASTATYNHTLADLFNGAVNNKLIVFSDKPITMYGYGSVPDKIVRGLAMPDQIIVYWDLNDLERGIRTIKHEVGHWCLAALGVTDEAQSHKAMADAGFNF